MDSNKARSIGLMVFLLAVCLSATIAGWYSARMDAEHRANERFQFRVNEIVMSIKNRMDAYEQVLRGGVALFYASDHVSRKDWHTYVENLKIENSFPGIQGIGFSKRIYPAELATHIRLIRAQGFPEYVVKPPGERAEYTAIIYLEPFNERNKRAFGFDMFSEPTRHAAMEQARDSGQTTISGKVKLVQETQTDVQAGFLMYLPVYRQGAPLATVAQRRVALAGYVYSPFRMGNLMRGILGKMEGDVELQIFDGAVASEAALMYGTGHAHAKYEHLFSAQQKVDINGNPWLVQISSLPGFEVTLDRQKPLFILVFGLFMTAMLLLLAWSWLSTRTRAQDMALLMTQGMREREERLRSIVDTAVDGIIVINQHGIVESFNVSSERIFGYSAAEVIGRNVSMLMPEPYHSVHDSYLQRYTQTNEARIIGIGREVMGLRKDGSVFPLDLAVGEMKMREGVRMFTGIVRDISDRVAAKNQLREQEKFANDMIENLTVPTFIIDTQHRVLKWNRACEELTGVKGVSVVGTTEQWRGFYDHARPCLADLVIDGATGMESGYYQNYEPSKFLAHGVHAEGWFPNMGGKRRYVIFDAAPLFDEQGNMVAAIESLQDITERKEADEALRDSEGRYRLLAEYASDMIARLSPAGVFDYVSPASANVLGSEPDELLGRSLFEFVHPEDRKRVGDALQNVLMNYQLETVTYRITNREGLQTWLETSLRGLHDDAAGGEKQIVTVSRDVTERIRIAQNLDRFKNILDNTLDMIFMFEPDTLRFIYLNRGAVETMGYTREELLGMTPYQIKPLMPEPKFREFIAPLLSGEKASLSFETVHRRKDGSDFPVEVFLQLVREKDEKGLFVAIVRDVTERKKVDRLKNEFVSTVSHELRTPLTSIRGSLGLILGGVAGDLAPQAKSLLDIAHKNSERLVRLINDILDIEKIESGKMQFDFKPQELMPIVLHAIETNRAYGEQHDVKFEVIASLQQAKVNVDNDRLVQVISNLLSNAAKFSPNGGRVEIAVTHEPGFIRVGVSDHGPGIPDDFHDKIFQKFSQADSSDTRAKGGTGLGLSITKAIVEKMGGEIGFESREGAGTTFYFKLPEWREDGVCMAGLTPVMQAHPRVLVCEDDADVAHLIEMMLNQGGFDTDVAASVNQARARLRSQAYAAMTLDLGLPDGDGIDLIRELRGDEATRHLPIVVVSGRSTEAHQAELNGSFAVINWLGKPIDNDELVAAVQRAVHSFGGYRPRILHIEDDPDIRQVIASMTSGMADFDYAETVQEASAKLSLERYNLVILDIALPDGSGWDLLPLLKKLMPAPAVLVFSAHDVAQDQARKVAAALVKSQTSDRELLDTIGALVRQNIARPV